MLLKMPLCMSRHPPKRFENQTSTRLRKWVNSNSKALHEVWLAVRAWKPSFEKFGASQKDMAHLEGAIRRLDQIASPELEKVLRGFQGW
jgi:hypothetical protein